MKISIPQPLSALTLQANQLKKIPETKGVSDDDKLREAANDFEAIFIQQMLKTMRKTSFESDLLPKSEGEKVFQSLLDEQYALLSAKSRSLGLSEMIYQQLKSNLENVQKVNDFETDPIIPFLSCTIGGLFSDKGICFWFFRSTSRVDDARAIAAVRSAWFTLYMIPVIRGHYYNIYIMRASAKKVSN